MGGNVVEREQQCINGRGGGGEEGGEGREDVAVSRGQGKLCSGCWAGQLKKQEHLFSYQNTCAPSGKWSDL